MSELRIRSEAPPPASFVDDWRPRSAQAPPDDGDDAPFMPMLLALEQQLSDLFGCPASVHPGRGLPPGAPDVAADLAALLATVRLGGDPARTTHCLGGVTTARHAGQLLGHVLPLAHRLWPAGSRRPEMIVDVLVTISDAANIVGSIRLACPPQPLPDQLPQPLGPGALGLPLRLAVRLAEDMLPLAMLLPLRPGLVIPVNACPDMPVHLGDHRIATATLTPLPDGRQQASITSIDIRLSGERA
jgi:hypothetical protein